MTPRTRALLALPLLLLALLGGPPAAHAEHPPESEQIFTGTITGTDGRAVNALLGFDWQNAQGRRIDRHGCVQSPECPLPGYATVLRVNPTLPATGSADTSTATTTWEVRAPADARQLFLEVYPQNERYRTDETRYGHAMRHSVALPPSEPLALQLPVTDCADGGTVGTLRGTGTKEGAPFPLRRVVAWSLETYDPATRPVLGWNIGTASQDGTFVVPNLPPEQRYQVWVTAADGSVVKAFGVTVPRCGVSTVAVSFDPPPPPPVPADPEPVPPPPPSPPSLVRPVVLPGQGALVDGGADPGTVVELLATAPDGTSRVVRSTTAGPSGYYAFTVFPTGRTPLRVRIDGRESDEVVLQVRSVASLALTRTLPRTFRVTGSVAPRSSQVVDLLLRLPGGQRRLLAITRSGADGRYAFTRRFAVLGSFDVYAATRGSEQALPGTSPVRRVVVR